MKHSEMDSGKQYPISVLLFSHKFGSIILSILKQTSNKVEVVFHK